jgi:pimeloyl-ACP methyl ester carboxylesterase
LNVGDCSSSRPVRQKREQAERQVDGIAEGNDSLVEAGGLKYHVAGEDGVTVVLDAGIFDAGAVWREVAAHVASFARVVSVDRRGAGVAPESFDWSPITAASATHRVLRRSMLDAPVIVVGWSLGGVYARAFVHAYPSRIGGLVLVEPLHEALLARHSSDTLDQLGTEWWPRDLPGSAIEAMTEAAAPDLRLLTNGTDLPGVPLVLITGDSAPLRSATREIIADPLHRETMGLAPGVRHIIAGRSGHAVPIDRPDVVVDAILEMVRAISAA